MKNTLLILSMLLPLFVVAQDNATLRAFKAEQIFAEGKKSYENGDFWNAISLFNEVEKLNANHQHIYGFRGEAYYNLGRYSEAIEDYSSAIELHPDEAQLYNARGVAQAKMELYRAAANDFEHVLELDPTDQMARDNLARANAKKDQYDQSFADNDRYHTGQDYTGGTAANNSNWNQAGQTANPSNVQGRDPFATNDPYSTNPYRTQPASTSTYQPSGLYTQGGNTTPSSGYRAPTPKNPNSAYSAGRNPVPTTPVVPNRLYKDKALKVGSQTDPMIQIKEVEVTPTSTVVTFEVESANDQPFPIRLERRGDQHAMYLTDRNFSKTYKLKTVRLRGWPDKPYIINPGQRPVTFQVEFERIDDKMNSFHVLEGKQDRKGSWDFFDVKLLK